MNPDIIIIGAGASGLMAARELAKAGKKVIILEARNRIGGRIMPLSESDFGYSAEGGAEFVHGEAPITRSLMKEAGLTFLPEDGEVWSMRSGELTSGRQFIEHNDSLNKKLFALKEDISIADFLGQNFDPKKDASFINSIIKMVQGYDAADPKLISTITIRDEWLATADDWDAGRIKEGYGALINFLESECKKYEVEILLNTRVKGIGLNLGCISVFTTDVDYKVPKVVITVPVSVLKDIDFNPELKVKIDLASKIGFGDVVKLIIKFKTRFWEHALEKDLSKMAFMLCNEKFMTWWTQYPEVHPVLVGWMAGPEAGKYKESSSEELVDVALTSLSNVFNINKNILKKEIVVSEVINWPADPFSKGAYSYTTIHTKDAYEQLAKPIDNSIFFAGEALCSGTSTAMVEGALQSGLETAGKILENV